ncbi:MAG: hypothetical protein ACTHXA_03335 [Gulosibacter sp.]|uniref:hypothetical protein n=1 Tax=Gulosibacter sp. TaxID=2817531 RepID=UPI003F905269
MRIARSHTRPVGIVIALVLLLILVGCSAEADETPTRPEGPTAAETIASYFDAIANEDRETLGNILGQHVDIASVWIPDTAPALEFHTADGIENPFPGEDKYVTVEIGLEVDGSERDWSALMRFVEYEGGDGRWEIVNGVENLRLPTVTTHAVVIPEEVRFDPEERDTLEYELSANAAPEDFEGTVVQLLPGLHTANIGGRSDLIESTDSGEWTFPVYPGDLSQAYHRLKTGMDNVELGLSEAGTERIESQIDELYSMCADWCVEPGPNYFETADFETMTEDTGIFRILPETEPTYTLLKPNRDNDLSDWEDDYDQLSSYLESDTELFVELQPLVIEYSVAVCDNSGCAESSDSQYPIRQDEVEFLYKFLYFAAEDTGELDLVAVRGNM